MYTIIHQHTSLLGETVRLVSNNSFFVEFVRDQTVVYAQWFENDFIKAVKYYLDMYNANQE